MDGEEGVVAVGDVVSTVVPHVFGEIDHAKAAVHPAVFLPIADPEPIPFLRQDAQGRPPGDGGQARPFSGVLIERQALDGPDGAVQRRDGGPERNLLRLEFRSVPVQGGDAEAVIGPGTQPPQVIAHALLRREAGGGLPLLPRPSLNLKVVALRPVPLQDAQPGGRLLISKRQRSAAGQVRRPCRNLRLLRQNEFCPEGLPAVQAPGPAKEPLPVRLSPDLKLQLLPRREAGEPKRGLGAIAGPLGLPADVLHLIQRRGHIAFGPIQLHVSAAVDRGQQVPPLKPGPLPAPEEEEHRRQGQQEDSSRRPHPHQPLGLSPGPPGMGPPAPVAPSISIPSRDPHPAPYK